VLRLFSIFALALLVPATLVVGAEPQLSELVPQGAQRGTEVVVSLRGPRLGNNPLEILWHEPGIEVRKLERVDDNQTSATLFVPEATMPGRYPMRLRTGSGISNVMTFHVGALPEINETEPNSDFAAPQVIPLGTVVNGVVQNEDVDLFQFEAKAGEPISVEVDGLRLGRTFFDPVITLYDAAGEELAKCDDWALVQQDACFSIVAPADGKYLLELRESAYRGSDQATYRLHVGKFPRPLAVYPPGGRAGETIKIEWRGDAGGAATEEVKLPDTPTDSFAYVPSSDRGLAPSPHYLRVVNMPVTGEVEPNNNAKEATSGAAPGAFYGVIGDEGDLDCFRVAAKQGQVFHLRLHARVYGSPVDAVLRVLDANGKTLTSNDDDRGFVDSYIRFQAPADGDFVFRVEDRLNRSGDTYTYWLEALPPDPLVNMELEEQERYVAKLLDVPQGNRNGAMIRAARQDTGGPLTIDWTNLPPGVSVEIPPVPGNYDRTPVILSAAADAPLGQSLATMTSRRTEDNTAVAAKFTQRNWFVRGRNNVDVWGYSDSRPVVAVTEKAPYTIRIEQPAAPLVQRGDKGVKVVAERAEGFTGAILVRMLYDPPGVSSNASLRIPENENEVLIPVTANEGAQVGEWPIAMRGEADVRGRLVTVTPIAKLKIAEPYLAMELPRPNVEQGQSVDFPIKIEQRTPFEGEATVELMSLPPGIATEPIKITKETQEITFHLKAAADARPGQHRGQFCRVTIIENGEPVYHSVGYGELRVDTPLPPPSEATAAR
jgi:hypothetical protein